MFVVANRELQSALENVSKFLSLMERTVNMTTRGHLTNERFEASAGKSGTKKAVSY